MCTAVSLGGFFGRNLDLEGSLGEGIVLTPRNCPLPLRGLPALTRHHAMAGAALVRQGFPLYFDALNEHGLGAAGLDFPGCAHYQPRQPALDNLAPFEFIPFLLGTCTCVEEARVALRRINLWEEAFSPDLPLTPMHFLLCDKRGAALAVEPGPEGLRVLDAPAGVLTNSPTLEEQMAHLARFQTPAPSNRGEGLPGDHSSPSRFVRTAFHRAHAPVPETPQEGVAQCMTLLSCAAVPRGSSLGENGTCRFTVYTACCDLQRGDYYLSPHENRRLTGVSLRRAGLEGTEPIIFPIPRQQDVGWVN